MKPLVLMRLFPITDSDPLKADEMYPDVARERMRQAVAACDRCKALAEARAAEMLLQRMDVPLLIAERKRLRSQRTRSELKARQLTVRGSAPRLVAHPELAGLSRKEYTTQLTRLRRKQFYAAGLTCRGTPRVLVKPKA